MSLPNRWRSSILVVVLLATAAPLFAGHAWSTYHWARRSNPFTLKLYDNVSASWEPYVSGAVSDWNKGNVANYSVVWQSPLSNTKRCTSATGVVEICNNTYGQNGWLGIAGISVSGSHITKGYTKLNDSYFNQAQYNTPAWRAMVTCQEIAHDFGLGHQDETFSNANLGSCMDYTNDPDGGAGGASSNDPSNEHPNQHDFDQLATIYNHSDSTTTIASSVLGAMAQHSLKPLTSVEIMSEAGQWGTPVHYDGHGRPDTFVLPTGVDENGEMMFDITHVLWTPEERGKPADQ